MSESKPRTRYTLEFKLEALKLVKGGQVAALTAKIMGIAKQTLENWVRLANKGQLKRAGDKPVSPVQWSWPGCALRTPDCEWSVTLWEKLRRTSRGFQSEVRLDRGGTRIIGRCPLPAMCWA